MTGWNEYPVSQDKNLCALRSLGVKTPSQALHISVMHENLTKPSSSGYFLAPPDNKYTIGNFPDYLEKYFHMSREGAREVTSYLKLIHIQKIPASVALSLITTRDTLKESKFSEREIKERLAKKYLETKESSKKRETIFKILDLS